MSSCNNSRAINNLDQLYQIGFECQVATHGGLSKAAFLLYQIGFECQVATRR